MLWKKLFNKCEFIFTLYHGTGLKWYLELILLAFAHLMFSPNDTAEPFQVKTLSLFGEVWGIGPTTALKLYEKGHRKLEDLKKEPSLTKAQKIGLQYFDDLKTRIPCHEVPSCFCPCCFRTTEIST